MCVFLLAPFDTLKSQPGIACKSVVYKKACNIVFFFLLKMKKYFATRVSFCVYLVFHWGNVVEKVLPKPGGSVKRLEGIAI